MTMTTTTRVCRRYKQDGRLKEHLKRQHADQLDANGNPIITSPSDDTAAAATAIASSSGDGIPAPGQRAAAAAAAAAAGAGWGSRRKKFTRVSE